MSVILQAGYDGISEDVNNLKIGFDTHLATATATNTATGYDPAWVTDGETWSFWRASGNSSTLTITFPSLTLTNYVGVAAHTLGTAGCDVQLQFSTNGSTFSNANGIGEHSPTDDSALFWMFNSINLRAIRLVFTGGIAQLAVFQAGEVFEFPRPCLFTGVPLSESKQLSYRHRQSLSGDVLGRAVEGAELEFELTVNNLPETFRAALGDVTWAGFKRHVEQGKAFFVSPKAEKYPDDVAYAQITEQPRFVRERPNFRLSGSVTLNCKGYAAP